MFIKYSTFKVCTKLSLMSCFSWYCIFVEQKVKTLCFTKFGRCTKKLISTMQSQKSILLVLKLHRFVCIALRIWRSQALLWWKHEIEFVRQFQQKEWCHITVYIVETLLVLILLIVHFQNYFRWVKKDWEGGKTINLSNAAAYFVELTTGENSCSWNERKMLSSEKRNEVYGCVRVFTICV